MDTYKLTINLPMDDADFLKNYAEKHKLSVSELIDRLVKRLKISRTKTIHPEIQKIAGIIPSDINAKDIYNEYIMDKHQ